MTTFITSRGHIIPGHRGVGRPHRRVTCGSRHRPIGVCPHHVTCTSTCAYRCRPIHYRSVPVCHSGPSYRTSRVFWSVFGIIPIVFLVSLVALAVLL